MSGKNHYHNSTPRVPLIPMLRILGQFAEAKGIKFDRSSWKSIKEVHEAYSLTAKLRN